jgi:DNA polymerase I-like protein with 3'-5' exonuclease and polymerase domains
LVHDEIVIEIQEDYANRAIKIIESDMIETGGTFLRSIPVVVDIKVDDVWKK